MRNINNSYENWSQVFTLAKPMLFYAFNTGYITGKLKTYTNIASYTDNVDGNSIKKWEIQAFYFSHPEKGDILIDCGFSKAFSEKPPYGNLPFVLKIFQEINGIRYTQEPREDFESFIEEKKIDPTNVFLTHMHPDHTSGLPSLKSDCKVWFGKKEDTFYYRFITSNHLKGKNKCLLDFEKNGFTLEPFEKVIDVFNDASLFAISTPGHTKDHIAYLINDKFTPRFILGDAELNSWAVNQGVKVSSDYGKKGVKDVNRSSEMIKRFIELFPNVEVHYSHEVNLKNQ